MFTVLFVCTGNTCRSPMAQFSLSDMLTRKHMAGKIKALSAGLWVGTGNAVSRGARLALEKRGIKTDDFLSRQFTSKLADSADCILTMTKEQLMVVVENFPAVRGKTELLGDFCGTGEEVSDPFGGSISDYERCLVQLERLLECALGKLTVMLEAEK